MKVKIGNKIMDSKEEPIMLIFENRKSIEQTAENLKNMSPGSTKYCEFPDSLDIKEAEKFMKQLKS